MSITEKKLYELLPAVYRIRDLEQGEPLKALIRILAREAGLIEENISQTYDNWFIETCEEWLVPYLSDLMAVRNLHALNDPSVYSQRAYVANTLGYRRRKGTVPVLEQLALDITGWRTRAVEFFQLLAYAQNVNHIQIEKGQFTDIRKQSELEYMNTAFDSCSRTADIRHIDNNRGRHNIPDIGLFVWRLQNYPVKMSDARAIPGMPGCFSFNPLGNDQQLFNNPQTETSITHIATELNVSGMLNRRKLYDELEQRRNYIVNNIPVVYGFFGRQNTDQMVCRIYLNGSGNPINPDEILIGNLETWDYPSGTKEYEQRRPGDASVKVSKTIQVAMDPVLGRLTFPKTVIVDKVLVSYSYGFGGDLGGGPYDRKKVALAEQTRKITWQAGVSKENTTGPGLFFNNLSDALNEWDDQIKGSVGLITIMDSRTYSENLTIKVPEGSQLTIMAADWPIRKVEENGNFYYKRFEGDWTADGLHPHLLGNVEVSGKQTDDGLCSGGELIINGLLIEGATAVKDGSNLKSLTLSHCTCVPQEISLTVNKGNEQLKILIKRSICGGIIINNSINELAIEECIIDNGIGMAVTALKNPVRLVKSTLFGCLSAEQIYAENCIFTGLLSITRQQQGCIRFSFLPYDSRTPRRYRCQPDLEIITQISKAAQHHKVTTAKKNKIKKQIRGWLVPSFTSDDYGNPGYGQLSRLIPDQIRKGADNESEMGVFNDLKQPQREANLLIALREYLPLGIESGVIHVT
jgi:hypothetical protein